MERVLGQSRTIRASGVMKLLSHPHRLMILCQLNQGEMSVGELAELIGIEIVVDLRRDLAEDGRVQLAEDYAARAEHVADVVKERKAGGGGEFLRRRDDQRQLAHRLHIAAVGLQCLESRGHACVSAPAIQFNGVEAEGDTFLQPQSSEQVQPIYLTL